MVIAKKQFSIFVKLIGMNRIIHYGTKPSYQSRFEFRYLQVKPVFLQYFGYTINGNIYASVRSSCRPSYSVSLGILSFQQYCIHSPNYSLFYVYCKLSHTHFNIYNMYTPLDNVYYNRILHIHNMYTLCIRFQFLKSGL